MKNVKAVNQGLTLDHNGTLLQISSEKSIVVDDVVASELHLKFGHLIEISDVVEEATPAVPVQEAAPEITQEQNNESSNSIV